MRQERHDALMFNVNLDLTQSEQDEGWHFCCDYDGLLSNKSDEDNEPCQCFE